MAFLDNSGDIILDAVLTDAGRFRLAKGDGSFKIVKYAFADDEIDYAKYNKTHASGSAYYDLDILKTPVLEAFTNNMSSMKHKLLSVPRTNLLYLPVLRLNELSTTGAQGFKRNQTANQADGNFIVSVDKNTNDKLDQATGGVQGMIKGFAKPQGEQSDNIVIDQGLNTTAISHTFALDPDLRETRYIIELDNRLGAITNENGQIMTPNFIDDDNVASYTVTQNSSMITQIPFSADDTNNSAIAGPRGTRLKFSILASIELNSSTFLFSKLGRQDGTFTAGTAYSSVNQIDTIVKVTGGSTGRSIDIPVRFLKITT